MNRWFDRLAYPRYRGGWAMVWDAGTTDMICDVQQSRVRSRDRSTMRMSIHTGIFTM